MWINVKGKKKVFKGFNIKMIYLYSTFKSKPLKYLWNKQLSEIKALNNETMIITTSR